MKNTNRRGFTLIELLIGMVLMVIVIAGITFGVVSGVKLYERANAQAQVLKGMRFTIDSFNRQIAPKLNNTNYVEILNTKKDHLPERTALSSDEKCLFLSGDALVLRSRVSDEVLPGSEYVSAVHFTTFSKDVDDDGNNYMLKMVLSTDAKETEYPLAKFNTTTMQALYNKPLRSTDNYLSSSKSFEGDILVYVAIDDDAYDVIFKNLHVLSGDSSEQLDARDVPNGTKLTASYDLYLDPKPSFSVTDASTFAWYITTDPTVKAGTMGTGQPTTDSAKTGYWLLVDNSGNAISTRTFDSSGTFKVKDSKGNTYSWLSSDSKGYGAVVCKVTPILKKADGSIVTKNTAAKYTQYVVVTKSTASASGGHKLWSAWANGIVNDLTTGYFKSGTVNNVKVTYSITGGSTYITLSRDAGTAASAIVAELSSDILDEETKASVETNNKSYTTITNYSIIVDAQVDNRTGGYGVLLSGASKYSNDSSFADCGYMLQFDRAIDAFPIRQYANGAYDYWADSYMIGVNMSTIGTQSPVNSLDYPLSDIEWNQYFGFMQNTKRMYRPSYLKNSIMNYTSYTTATDPLAGRTRFMITVLEYYTTSKAEPKIIVRTRLLKTDTEVAADGGKYSSDEEKKDPWHIGPKYYKSEPAWYGDFVGSKPVSIDHVYDYYNTNCTYNYNVSNYSGYSGGRAYMKNIYNTAPNTTVNRYIVKGNVDGSNSFVGVFIARVMDIISNLDSGSTSSDNKDIAKKEFGNPARKRYLGLRIWNKEGSTQTQFYSVNHAPGFRKEELEAIMPSGAHMYEVSETGQKIPDGVDQSDLDKSLSLINGKGVMSLQHTPSHSTGGSSCKCKCPWCTYYEVK